MSVRRHDLAAGFFSAALCALAGPCAPPAPGDGAGMTDGVAEGVAAAASAHAPPLPLPHPSASHAGEARAPDAARPPEHVPAPLPSLAPAPSFGPSTPIPRYSCPNVVRGGPFKSYLAAADTKLAFVDGDDSLALVNRSPTGALPPEYAPSDLVDLHDGKPRTAAECEASRECLRRDAASALRSMLDAMKDAKMPGHVSSSFRAFGTQCWVFAGWASKARGGFCEATEQSALPGHSQHQLGTTIDLFTEEWAQGGGVFRNGFGCTPGGKWLDENAWKYGFVLPYPIHPDDRKDGSRCEARRDHAVPLDPKTGYKNEPWHLRFLGADAAARYHEAWLASGPGTFDEITLEQWLRRERGLAGDGELPVCDGCQCGACATLAEDDAQTPCGKESLHLDADGRVVQPADSPHVIDARATTGSDGITRVEVVVHAPAHTPTQPPVMNADGPVYPTGASYLALAPTADLAPHKYPDLKGAWRVAVEPVPSPTGTRWPWRSSLANAKLADTWNRANLVLPAKSGDITVPLRIALPAGVKTLKVTLLHDGVEHDLRDVDVH
ncbi:MAG TPA: M15 family metallopeptidase [Polyangiaceae bacterium]|nr:M15 family metallopeptidase [Polyangiaceae bacterium]